MNSCIIRLNPHGATLQLDDRDSILEKDRDFLLFATTSRLDLMSTVSTVFNTKGWNVNLVIYLHEF